MKKRKRPGFFLAWIDMLYGQMAGFLFLFALAVLLISVPSPVKPGEELRDEFLIKLTWPDTSFDDIDVHLLMPNNKIVNFRHREEQYVFLDHDDLGQNGRFTDANGVVHLLTDHIEKISIRAVVPGTYVVNVHVFRVNKKVEIPNQADAEPKLILPYNVHLSLMKIHPYTLITEVDVEMHSLGEQRTAFVFTVLPNGWATVDTSTDVPFIPVKEYAGGFTNNPNRGPGEGQR